MLNLVKYALDFKGLTLPLSEELMAETWEPSKACCFRFSESVWQRSALHFFYNYLRGVIASQGELLSIFDVRESVHHSTILTVKNPTRCTSVIKILLLLILTLIPLTWRIGWAPNNASKWQMVFNSAFKGLNETQHVSGDTPPIIRGPNLHQQPLVLHTWKVVGRAVVGLCQAGL